MCGVTYWFFINIESKLHKSKQASKVKNCCWVSNNMLMYILDFEQNITQTMWISSADKLGIILVMVYCN